MQAPDPRRALPGYDTGADVFETAGDLTEAGLGDSNGAAQAEVRAAARGEGYATSEEDDREEDEDVEDAGDERVGAEEKGRVSASDGLYPAKARERFGRLSQGVRTKGVDLSDRVDGGRRGYRVHNNGGTRRDGRDEGRRMAAREEEGLAKKLARLRREVEECRVEAERARERDSQREKGLDGESEVDALLGLMAGLELEGSTQLRREGMRRREGLPPPSFTGDMDGDGEEEMTGLHSLTQFADFDTRLSALEHALGISTLDTAAAAATLARDSLAMPVLPSLAALDQQLRALSSAASLTGLEAARSRVQVLANEAAQLSSSHPDATTNTQAGPTRPTDVDPTALPSLTPADFSKLQSLASLLPILHSQTPTLPALLARLRSLKALHTRAASAAGDLEDLENGQAELDEGLKAWRKAVEMVEKGVGEVGEANGRNGKVVEGWVRDLEGRLGVLGKVGGKA